MSTVERLRARLEAALAPEEIEILDESDRHRGHAGAASGGGHYHVRIVSERFGSLGLLARQRLVYAALADEMGSSIHALSMETLTPAEAEGRGCGR